MDYKKATPDKWHYYLSDRYAWSISEKSGFGDYFSLSEQPHIVPQIRKLILNIYDESYEKPWKFLVWDPVFLLWIVSLVIGCFYWFPRSAVFSAFLISCVIPLVLLSILNWRYFYFFYFGLQFLVPLMILDRTTARDMDQKI